MGPPQPDMAKAAAARASKAPAVAWPLDEALQQPTHPRVRQVAAERRPAVMTALAWLMRWPDLLLGCWFVEGFALLGHVEEPALFRELDDPCPPPSSLGLASVQGDRARAVVDQLCSTLKPHEHSQFLSEFTRDKILQGIASGPFTREQLDVRFGVGNGLPGHNALCFAAENLHV